MWSNRRVVIPNRLYRVRRPANPPLEAPILNEPPVPDFSDISLDSLTNVRNHFVEKECCAIDMPVSVVDLESTPNRFEADRPLDRATEGKGMNKYKADSRFRQILNETTTKITDLLKISNDNEFDYLTFQSILKLEHILSQAEWLKKQLSAKTLNDIDWWSLTHYGKPLDKQFEAIYGPILKKTPEYWNPCACLYKTRQEVAKKANKIMEHIWRYKIMFGKDAAEKVIDELMKTEMDSLKLLHGEKTGSELLEHVRRKESIYNVNPVTSLTHSEWFLIPRFCQHQIGPSNLIIKHEDLEDLLIEYKKPPGITIVEGYWPSLIDLTFSHPVRWCIDPLLKVAQELHTAKDPVDAKSVRQGHQKVETHVIRTQYFWMCLYEQMRKMIMSFPLGIEADLFMNKIMIEHKYIEDIPLFPGMSNQDAAKKLEDLFITSELPGTNKLILFPAYLKGILPDYFMPALGILRRVWKRMIFTVKIYGGIIRSQDLYPLYWRYWKVQIDTCFWGFDKPKDFIKWCTWLWNGDGEEEGLIVEADEGETNLVYTPPIKKKIHLE